MELRCKPGDLAVVVKSELGNEGKVVKCIRLATENDVCMNGCSMNPERGPWWFIDSTIDAGLLLGGTHKTNVAPDSHLRPIRDSDGQDETLTWVPVPKKVEA